MQILDLPVEPREELGSAGSRRYCRAGKIPMVLYGRGKDNLFLVTSVDDFERVQKAHTAIVRLRLGDKDQTALIRDVSWDTFGEYVQHVDLMRVGLEDEVEIRVPIHYAGVPVGTHAGGEIQIVHADIELLCRVNAIPSEVKVDISKLNVGDGLHVGDLEYPAHVRPARAAAELLIQVREPRKIEELVPVVAEPEEGEEEAPAEPGAEEAPPEPAAEA